MTESGHDESEFSLEKIIGGAVFENLISRSCTGAVYGVSTN